MNVFLDTEFSTDAAGNPLLISIGLCSEAGQEFYAEVELDGAPIGLGEFVEEHVLPQLGKAPERVGSMREIAGQLVKWFNTQGQAELDVCYDYNVDYLLTEQLVQMVPETLTVQLRPTHIGYLLDDPSGLNAAEACWHELETKRGIRRHHALADALALQARYRAVHGD